MRGDSEVFSIYYQRFKFDFKINLTIHYDHLHNTPIGLVVEKPVTEVYTGPVFPTDKRSFGP